MIVASMTTVPKRVSTLPLVIEAILNQSISVDELHLNIPYLNARTGEVYDLSNSILNNSRVKLFRTEDYGPITKVAPTFLRTLQSPETLIFAVDDDFAYSKDTLERLIRAKVDHPRIITRYGGALSDMGDMKSWFGSGRASFLEDFGGVLYPANIVKRDFPKLLSYVKRDGDLLRSDDIVLSTYFNYHSIEIYLHNPITSKDSYGMTGQLDTASLDALCQEDTHDNRLRMYRRAFFKTKSFLDSFWEGQ